MSEVVNRAIKMRLWAFGIGLLFSAGIWLVPLTPLPTAVTQVILAFIGLAGLWIGIRDLPRLRQLRKAAAEPIRWATPTGDPPTIFLAPVANAISWGPRHVVGVTTPAAPPARSYLTGAVPSTFATGSLVGFIETATQQYIGLVDMHGFLVAGRRLSRPKAVMKGHRERMDSFLRDGRLPQGSNG